MDRLFVNDKTMSHLGLALVSTIINPARSTPFKAVAGGIESSERTRLLQLLGCDEMQDFQFRKAVPRDVFETKYLTTITAG